MSSTRVKICGLSTRETMAAACNAGAAYVGLMFFAKSPRHLEIDAARALAIDVPPGVAKVAVTVNADDAHLDQILATVPIDMLQLHGSETPERIAELRSRHGLPIMKAIGIATQDDLARLETYEAAADQVLVDAKPPPDGEVPGGNGIAFDWRLIANRRWNTPWMLSGGLNDRNVTEAIALTGASQIDLSSGVESAPGIKDTAKIAALFKALG